MAQSTGWWWHVLLDEEEENQWVNQALHARDFVLATIVELDNEERQ